MFRLLGWLFGFGMFLALGGVAAAAVYLTMVMAQLPDYTVLKDYQPPVTTRVHAADGTLLAEYARERRLFQPVGRRADDVDIILSAGNQLCLRRLQLRARLSQSCL